MQKLNIPIKRWRKKYMILYQTEINNFCINVLFHEHNRKLHYRRTKWRNELLGHPVVLRTLSNTSSKSEMHSSGNG